MITLLTYSASNLEIPGTRGTLEVAKMKIESSDQAGCDSLHYSCVFYGMYRSETHYILAHEKIYNFYKISKCFLIFSKISKISLNFLKLLIKFKIFRKCLEKIEHLEKIEI